MAAKNKGGRPRHHEEAKREQIGLRVTPTMKRQIAAAAEGSGRSIAQEVEQRLEMSFLEDRLLGGRDVALLTNLIASVIAMIERVTKRPWSEDRPTWEAVNAAVQRILSWFQSPIDLDIWQRHDPTPLLLLDPVFKLDELRRMIDEIEHTHSAKEQDSWPDDIKQRYDKALTDYAETLEEAKRRARAIFEGPMREQDARNREAIKLGRALAGQRQGKWSTNFIVGGIARMFKSGGQIEPLTGLRDLASIPEDELRECIRTLAGLPPDDPDLSILESRTPHWADFDD